MRIAQIVSVLALFACGVTARAASQTDPHHALLGKMVGKWVLKGTIGKRTTTHDVTAKWVLNEEYVEIHETSREKDTKGKARYEAIVYVVWDRKGGQFDCLWLDTTGVSTFAPSGIGHGKQDANRILFRFGDRNDGIETTFSYDGKHDSWAWNIDNLDHNKVSPFARLVLTKQ